MSARGRRIAAVALKRAALGVVGARFGLTSPARRRASFARQARLACEELGPGFIKLGQLASVRPDIFSAETVFELEKLQDSVPPVPVEAVRRVIRADLGREPEEIFASFEDEPLASASIAQVHRATLADEYAAVCGGSLSPGTRIVVKVVRPGAARTIEADLQIARRWARRFSRMRSLERFNLEGFLDEFDESLHSELDMRNEGRVADRFRFDFRDDPLVLVPRVVWSQTTRRVLTMEYIEGWRLTDITEAERSGVDAYGLAVHGANVFMRQVLVFGRFHADLHPANVFVTPDSRICYLDFGIIGRTQPRQRVAIAQVLAATVYGDADRAIRYSAELGLQIPKDKEIAVRDHVADLMSRTLSGPGRADVRGFAIGFLSMLSTYRIHVPRGYGLLIKALVTVEGCAQRLYPDIDIAGAAKPFATRLIAREMMRPARLQVKLPDALRAAMRELAE
ncbi:MAG: AarF/UbiB family protein [Coriobacteriia bacterium]|nr:AarF/UbiB family protein [Coriobacteriia bacterium]